MSDFLMAEAGIRQLHARYVDAVWRLDRAAFADCWTEDAQWRIAGHVLRGREEITNAWQTFMARYSHVLMTMRPPILEVGDGVASGRTYVTEQNKVKDGGNVNSIATYYEHFALGAGGRWRRSWAFFQLHYLGPADLSGTFYSPPDYGAPPAMPALDEATVAHARPQA
jgi:ketosteroid isomerase-like protein